MTQQSIGLATVAVPGRAVSLPARQTAGSQCGVTMGCWLNERIVSPIERRRTADGRVVEIEYGRDGFPISVR